MATHIRNEYINVYGTIVKLEYVKNDGHTGVNIIASNSITGEVITSASDRLTLIREVEDELAHR